MICDKCGDTLVYGGISDNDMVFECPNCHYQIIVLMSGLSEEKQ